MTQAVLDGIIMGSSYALIALSFSLIYAPSRFFHVAHGGVLAWGAYFGYIAYVRLNLPLSVAVPLAVGGSAVLGVALQAGVYGPLQRRGAAGLVLLLASLGLYIVLQNGISVLFGDEVKSLRGGEVARGTILLGASITPVQMWIVAGSLASFMLIGVVLRFTRFGLALRAVASDPEMARVRGVNVSRVVLGAFALGSALAGLAALLVAFDADMTPTMGLNAMMFGIVALIVGGVDSTMGPLLGGLLLGLAQHVGVWKIGSQWQDAITFLILILFLLFRPQGFLGRPRRRAAV
jgi:branched-chain amino acid transport system permease protein